MSKEPTAMERDLEENFSRVNGNVRAVVDSATGQSTFTVSIPGLSMFEVSRLGRLIEVNAQFLFNGGASVPRVDAGPDINTPVVPSTPGTGLFARTIWRHGNQAIQTALAGVNTKGTPAQVLKRKAQRVLNGWGFIDCIKFVRSEAGMDLADAVAYVRALPKRRTLVQVKQPQQSFHAVTRGTQTHEASINAILAGLRKDGTKKAVMDRKVHALCAAGWVIDAIKLVRVETGMSLPDAKFHVDAIRNLVK